MMEMIFENATVIPYWVSLKQACALKGINYKTACNKKILQPNAGVPDAYVGGRKKWKRETIERWIQLTDLDMEHDRKEAV